jgi:dimethylargininase
MSSYGCRDMTGTLRRVLVRRPPAATPGSWQRCGWRADPDAAALAAEHEALCALLVDAGADVVVAGEDGELDSIYAFDPALVVDGGALLLHPGKQVREAEPGVHARALESAGVPRAGRMEGPPAAEGGDLLRLDEQTLLAGIGYRTNRAGVDFLAELLPELDVIAFDLPHFHGPCEVMHLLSLLSPLDRDLVVAFPPLMPVRLVELLGERGIRIVEVPEDEFPTMGTNVLALGPRRALAVEGNPETRRRMEQAGVEVTVYRGEQLSLGDGGPTCLTLPLARD